jgi:AraC family transcriptional activator of pobA
MRRKLALFSYDPAMRTIASTRPESRRRSRSLPAFSLYGEAAAPGLPLLHVEAIQTRSRLYDGEIDSHVHQGLHQVVWLRAGPVEAVLDDWRTAGPGPLAIVLPPGVAHAFRFSPASDGHVLTFDARLLAEGEATGLADALRVLFDRPAVLQPRQHEAARLQALFTTLLGEHESGEPAPVVAWLARAVVWRLAELAVRVPTHGPLHTPPGARPGTGPNTAPHAPRGASPNGQKRPGALAPPRRADPVASRSPAGALYTRWVALMEAHYREHWPVARYAGELGLGTERLNRLLRAETGRNAQALLHERLVREASRRLVHVAAPVSSIAFELGFEDPAYFCRFFKRHVGLGPREYRRHARQAPQQALGGD